MSLLEGAEKLYGLGQKVISASKKGATLIRDFHGSEDDMNKVLSKLSSTQIVLDALARFEPVDLMHLGIPRSLKTEFISALQNCEDTVDKIDEFMSQYSSDSMRRRMKWSARDKEKTTKYLSELTTQIQWLETLVQTLNLHSSVQSHNDRSEMALRISGLAQSQSKALDNTEKIKLMTAAHQRMVQTTSDMLVSFRREDGAYHQQNQAATQQNLAATQHNLAVTQEARQEQREQYQVLSQLLAKASPSSVPVRVAPWPTPYTADISLEIIQRLISWNPNNPKTSVPLEKHEIVYLCNTAREIFKEQTMLLNLLSPIRIFGCINGQFSTLRKIFATNGLPSRQPSNPPYLFLGDYVCSGGRSIETMCLLLALKIQYRHDIFLLRGHQECRTYHRWFEFYNECLQRYDERLWLNFMDCFDCLPAAAIVAGKCFAVHGGISPDLRSKDSMYKILRIPQPSQIPRKGLLHDLICAHMDKSVGGPSQEDILSAGRVKDFLTNHGLKYICRSHVRVDGYSRSGEVITIYSAPNDRGESNRGAFLNVAEKDDIRYIS